MAKQSGGMPKIDEDFMKELISQGVPAKRESQPDDTSQPGGEMNITQEEQQVETVRVEKTTPRKRKGGTGDYRETYFQKVELADRQPLYVSRTTHEKLMRIVTVIGGRKVTVSSYVENILLRHFEQYQDEINTLYESQSDYGNLWHTYRTGGVLSCPVALVSLHGQPDITGQNG